MCVCWTGGKWQERKQTNKKIKEKKKGQEDRKKGKEKH
jgi:hypothetical protein